MVGGSGGKRGPEADGESLGTLVSPRARLVLGNSVCDRMGREHSEQIH